MTLALDQVEDGFVTVEVTVTKPKSDDFCVSFVRYRVPMGVEKPPPPRPNEVRVGIFESVRGPDPSPWRAREAERERIRVLNALAIELATAALAFGGAAQVELNPQPIPPGHERAAD